VMMTMTMAMMMAMMMMMMLMFPMNYGTDWNCKPAVWLPAAIGCSQHYFGRLCSHFPLDMPTCFTYDVHISCRWHLMFLVSSFSGCF
jgi:hypothetical protein